MKTSSFSVLIVLLSGIVLTFRTAAAAEQATEFAVGQGRVRLSAPATWKKVQPRSRIIEHEFAVEPAEGDTAAGRVTVMGAGGSIDDNIERWLDQFSQPDGSNTKDKAKIEKKTIAGQDVRLVDIAGTYKDMPGGPFAGGKVTQRPDYRMLAAIIVTPDVGNYFVKFYGPAKTVAENEKAFAEMVESLTVK